MNKKALTTVLVVLQMLFILCCFVPVFFTTDPENSSDGLSLLILFVRYSKELVFAAGILSLSFIAPMSTMLVLKKMERTTKFILSAALVLLSILSLAFFYYKGTESFCGQYQMIPVFYIMLGAQIISIILCLTGFFSDRTKT